MKTPSSNLFKRERVLPLPAWSHHLLLGMVTLGLSLNTLAESLLLSGATVHTVSGETLAPGQVLLRDGRIAAVGTHEELAAAPGYYREALLAREKGGNA